MKMQGVSSLLSVYKDQTVGANKGKLIEVGDTVTLIIRQDGGANQDKNVTVVAVADGAKSIFWDQEVTNVVTEEVDRIHVKHNYEIVADEVIDYEIESEADMISFASITINGVVYTPTASVTGTPSAAKAEQIEDLINDEVVKGNGYVNVVFVANKYNYFWKGSSGVTSASITNAEGTPATVAFAAA